MKNKQLTLYSALLLAPGIMLAQAVADRNEVKQNEKTETTLNVSEPGEELIERETAAEAAADSLATYEMLDDIVIETVRQAVKSDGATTTYSVDDDPSSKGRNLLEVLRNIPGVTVDGNDNILIQGKSDYKIMVNGREEPMLSANAKEIFKSMPASSVAKIEVITDPGAKFDAEGTAGVLNLITERKQKQNGFNGNLSAGVSNADNNLGGFFTGRFNKVTAQLNLMYAGNEGVSRHQKNSNVNEYLGSGEKLIERVNQKPDFNYLQGGYKLSWEPDSRNLFTTSFSFTLMNASVNKARQSDALIGPDGKILWQTGLFFDASIDRNSYDADVSYQHNFDDLGHLIVASYAFNFGDNSLDFSRTYDMQEGISYPWRMKDLNRTLWRMHTAQIDYSNPFRSEHHKLEAGLKGTFRRNGAIGWEKQAETLESEWFPNLAMNSDIMQFQDIIAAYGSYTFTSDKWNAKAGVRYENTRMGIHFHDGSQSNFQTRLNDVVPNASVTYSFGPATNLRLAYSMRISRPTIDQVNPFEQTLGYNGQKGNPDLSSERLNKLSLSYTSFGRSFGGSIGVDYSHTANAIEGVTSTDGLYTLRTYKNTGDRQSVGFHGFLNWTIINNMTLSLNGDLEWKNLKAPALGYQKCGWGGNFGANWSYRKENIATFGAFGGWGSRHLNLQGYWGSWYYYGISVGRDFLKDKSLNVTVNSMNFIDPIHIFRSETVSKDLKMKSRGISNNFKVGVSVSWSFGSLREQVKSTAADLRVDDAASGSGAGQGQSGGIGL